MMQKAFSVAVLAVVLASPLAAQQGAPQAPPTVTGFLRNLYNGNKASVLRVADRMPEEFYGLRPGAQEEVRTFGQHVAHVASFNNETYGSMVTTLRIRNISPQPNAAPPAR